MTEMMYREALNAALFYEMNKNENVFVLGENIGERGGPFKVTEGLIERFGPERVIDTPISEATFTGVAVGSALVGTRPIVETLFIDFTTLAMDQLINQAAKYRFMSGEQGFVPMVLRTQGGAGGGLAAQHSQCLEAIYYHIPGLKIVSPSTPREAYGLLISSIREDEPVVFIEHKLLYSTIGEVPDEDYNIPIGKADIKKSGDAITLITYSFMTLKCLEAAELLAKEGIQAEVIDLCTLKPIDKNTILNSIKKTGKCIIIHEACKRGGIGGDIASMIMEEAYDYLDGPILRVCGKDTPIPYNINLEKVCIPSVEEILEGVLKLV